MDLVFETLAEPNRRRILDLLREGERPAGDFVSALDISQPGVSRHLRILREAELVSVRQDGQRRLYRLNGARLANIDAWLAPYRRFWSDKLDALEDHLDRETPQ
jgi:DNA-binding transcriptional ArsR family regulator